MCPQKASVWAYLLYVRYYVGIPRTIGPSRSSTGESQLISNHCDNCSHSCLSFTINFKSTHQIQKEKEPRHGGIFIGIKLHLYISLRRMNIFMALIFPLRGVFPLVPIQFYAFQECFTAFLTEILDI